MQVGIVLAVIWVGLVYKKLRVILDYCNSTVEFQRANIDGAERASEVWEVPEADQEQDSSVEQACV